MSNRYWTKDGVRWSGKSIVHDGWKIFNPSDEQLIAAGYELHEVEPYVPMLDDVKMHKLAEIAAYDTSRL